MVFLWFSYSFSSGLVAVVAPLVAAGSGCPAPVFLWFSYGFPMVFLHFQLWAGGCDTSTGRHRLWVPGPSSYAFTMVFLCFSDGFPVVFLHL